MAFLGRDAAALGKAADELASDAIAVQVDPADNEAVRFAVSTVGGSFGGIDFVVNPSAPRSSAPRADGPRGHGRDHPAQRRHGGVGIHACRPRGIAGSVRRVGVALTKCLANELGPQG